MIVVSPIVLLSSPKAAYKSEPRLDENELNVPPSDSPTEASCGSERVDHIEVRRNVDELNFSYIGVLLLGLLDPACSLLRAD
jgi:hypothetical protein